jgi:hypothetical protein
MVVVTKIRDCTLVLKYSNHVIGNQLVLINSCKDTHFIQDHLVQLVLLNEVLLNPYCQFPSLCHQKPAAQILTVPSIEHIRYR